MSATAILPTLRNARSELARWAIAGVLVLAAHVALFAGYWVLRPAQLQGVDEAPAVIIDLAPMTVAPTPQPLDLAPGPPTPPPEPQAPPPKPEVVEAPKPEIAPKIETKIEPAPVPPLVTLPEPKPPLPPEVKPELKPQPKPEPKPVETPKQAAPPPPPPQAQTAPPKAREVAPAPAAARAGSRSNNTVAPSWISALLAHLNRYKRYPEAARSRRGQGVVMLAFTVDRSGHVLARHITRSSGTTAFDDEALAMLRRAEPLPPFPASMSGPSRSFNVPIRFALH